uniref:DNA-directed RNA polymerase subunit alpha n=1 Tax=Trebouxia aggregata TaxID=160068 RepID=G8XPG0_9CHLO|nr:alpha subunit of RNA polymerase [Trebouxia aggregata]
MEPLLLSCIESRVENSRNLYGRFQLGPFISGQALTIANSLRRSLLSEISGLAITAVVIEGVAHEYSTVAGVRESVLDLLLNVKQIVLTSNFQFQEPQIAFLEVQGPAIVRASDIKLPVSVQSVDPEQYIATLLYDGVLQMKFIICRGKNYIVQTPLGLKIPDSIFDSMQAEIDLTKPAQVLKQNVNDNTSLSKKNDSSWRGPSLYPFAGEGTQKSLRHPNKNKGDEKESSVLTSNTSDNDINNDIANNLRQPNKNPILGIPSKNDETAIVNSQNQLKNSQQYPNSSANDLLNYGRISVKNSLKNLSQKEEKKARDKERNTENFGEMAEMDKVQPIRFKDTWSILPIDAVFMPINKVNFAIETNDKSEVPKDRIILEIWTNGSIHPKQAIHDAAKALIQLIAPFQEAKNFKSVFMSSRKILRKALSSSESLLKKKSKSIINPRLKRKLPSLDIGNLELSLRPYTCLKRAKIETVADLLQYSSEDLLNLKHFGKNSLNEVEYILNQMGLKLRSCEAKKKD